MISRIHIRLTFPSRRSETYVADVGESPQVFTLVRPTTRNPDDKLLEAHVVFRDVASGEEVPWGFTIMSDQAMDYFPPSYINVPSKPSMFSMLRGLFRKAS